MSATKLIKLKLRWKTKMSVRCSRPYSLQDHRSTRLKCSKCWCRICKHNSYLKKKMPPWRSNPHWKSLSKKMIEITQVKLTIRIAKWISKSKTHWSRLKKSGGSGSIPTRPATSRSKCLATPAALLMSASRSHSSNPSLKFCRWRVKVRWERSR
jgi:hypothetical protein